MDLRQLEYFQAVSRLGSITRAAEEKNIAQPSVTVALNKLEEELGVKLLNRTHKKCELTQEGRVFITYVDKVFEYLNDATQELRDYREAQKGSLKIGITPIMGAFLFPNAFAKYQQENPDVNVTIVEEGSLLIRRHLEQGEIDIGIMITSNITLPLAVFPITSGQIHVCLSRSDPLSLHSRIPLEDLRSRPFILFKEDTYIRQLILSECNKLHFTPKIAFSSSQIGTVLGMVEQGVGISFLLEGIVRDHTEIVSRPLHEPLYLDVGLAWNKSRYLSTTAKKFIRSFHTSLHSV